MTLNGAEELIDTVPVGGTIGLRVSTTPVSVGQGPIGLKQVDK